MSTLAVGPKALVGRSDDVDMARDQALIARAQAGDKGAFDELYVHYSRRLYRLCLRRLSDAHEAQDVAQEAFVRAWRALPRFCGERRFYPWLSVIATNLCTDVLRKRSRSTPVAEFYGADPTSGEALDEGLMAEVDAQMVSAAYAKLTERHRRILALREGSGLSYQAIAEHEGVAISAVETLLWRARQALKREFSALAQAERPVAVIGMGALAEAFHHLVRVPSQVAKRLGALSPASATVALGSVAAATGLALGTTHLAQQPAPSPLGADQAGALAPVALGSVPAPGPGTAGASSTSGPGAVPGLIPAPGAGWALGASADGPGGAAHLPRPSGPGSGDDAGVDGPGSSGAGAGAAPASTGAAAGAVTGALGTVVDGAGSALRTTASVTTALPGGTASVVGTALSGVEATASAPTSSATSALSSTASTVGSGAAATASSTLGAATKTVTAESGTTSTGAGGGGDGLGSLLGALSGS